MSNRNVEDINKMGADAAELIRAAALAEVEKAAAAQRAVHAARERVFLPARAVWERYGISQMSLWRWLKEPRMNFPRPVYLGRYRYFRIAELEAYEAEIAAERDQEDAA